MSLCPPETKFKNVLCSIIPNSPKNQMALPMTGEWMSKLEPPFSRIGLSKAKEEQTSSTAESQMLS
jgi:hypothetical protein